MERSLVTDCLEKVGAKVKLQGWVNTVRDHGKITFIDLRDLTGIIQCVGKDLPKATPESVIEIEGTINQRPERLINKNIPIGTIEIGIDSLKVISMARELPFPLDTEGYDIEEATRNKYRYLDLRRSRMARNIRVRSRVAQFIRN